MVDAGDGELPVAELGEGTRSGDRAVSRERIVLIVVEGDGAGRDRRAGRNVDGEGRGAVIEDRLRTDGPQFFLLLVQRVQLLWGGIICFFKIHPGSFPSRLFLFLLWARTIPC